MAWKRKVSPVAVRVRRAMIPFQVPSRVPSDQQHQLARDWTNHDSNQLKKPSEQRTANKAKSQTRCSFRVSRSSSPALDNQAAAINISQEDGWAARQTCCESNTDCPAQILESTLRAKSRNVLLPGSKLRVQQLLFCGEWRVAAHHTWLGLLKLNGQFTTPFDFRFSG